MAPPTSIRISARLKRVQRHSSPARGCLRVQGAEEQASADVKKGEKEDKKAAKQEEKEEKKAAKQEARSAKLGWCPQAIYALYRQLRWFVVHVL